MYFFHSLRHYFYLVLLLLGLHLDACSSQKLCSIHSDCPLYHYCMITTGECKQDCKRDNDCLRGFVCRKEVGLCTSTKNCTKHFYKACRSGHIYWLDSCDFQEDIVENCSTYGCSGSVCNPPNHNCGNGQCQKPQENCNTCPKDCACKQGSTCNTQKGLCENTTPTHCGNKSCESAKQENCTTCPQDCTCGNGLICQNGRCTKAPRCGDGQCQTPQENCQNCLNDCLCPEGKICKNAQCVSNSPCGNGKCEQYLKESCGNCPKDCICMKGFICLNDQCTKDLSCGDGICKSNENCGTCPKDCTCLTGQVCQNEKCVNSCGDGICDPSIGEYCSTCPKDCACKQGQYCSKQTCENCLCTPNQKRCNNLKIEKCAADCTAWRTIQVCEKQKNQYCEPSTTSCKCTANGCSHPNSYRCYGKTRQICVKGSLCTYWQNRSCPANRPICNNGRCCICIPGQTKCYGLTQIDTCRSDCLGWTRTKCNSPKPMCCNNLGCASQC